MIENLINKVSDKTLNGISYPAYGVNCLFDEELKGKYLNEVVDGIKEAFGGVGKGLKDNWDVIGSIACGYALNNEDVPSFVRSFLVLGGGISIIKGFSDSFWKGIGNIYTTATALAYLNPHINFRLHIVEALNPIVAFFSYKTHNEFKKYNEKIYRGD